MKKNQIFISLSLIILASILIFTSDSSRNIQASNDEILSAYGYVIIISVSLIFISLIHLISAMRDTDKASDHGETYKNRTTINILLLIIFTVFFILGMIYIGFYISSFFFVILIFLTIENWKISKTKIVKGVIFSLFLNFILFITLSSLDIFLPDTILF